MSLAGRGHQADGVVDDGRVDVDLPRPLLHADQVRRAEHRADLIGGAQRAVDDRVFLGGVRVADDDLHHEPVDLRLRQRVGALGLDRVLRRHDQKRLGHLVGLAADGDLMLLHHLEQGALHLGGRPVDLVGEQQVGEDRAELGLELAGVLMVDPRSGQVGWHQVGGELDALELPADGRGERLDGQRLGQPGDALHEQVPAGKQGDRHALEQDVLADDGALDLEEHRLQRVGVRVAHIWGPFPGPLSPLPPSAAPMGTANPMPANASSPSGVASETTMPMTRPCASSSGPPELPGLTDASNWMRPGELAVVGVRGPVKAGDHPGGHAVGQAERIADGDDGCSHIGAAAEVGRHDDLGQPRRGKRGDVQLRVGGGDGRVRRGAVGERDGNAPAAGDDVIRGQDRAVVGHDDAGAQVVTGADDDHGRGEPLIDGRNGQVPSRCRGGAWRRGLGLRLGWGVGEAGREHRDHHEQDDHGR